MNRIILIPILFFVTSIYSQDYIVKSESDTLFCEIVYTKANGLNYIAQSSDSIEYLGLEEFSTYFKSYDKFRLGISGGYGYRPIEISGYPTGLESYAKGIKSGINVGLDFSYSTSAVVAYGIKYSLFLSNNSKDNFNYVDSLGNPINTGPVKNNIQIHYIGPTLSTRAPIGKRRFLIELSLGYLYYREKAIVIEPMTITGGTFGMNINLQYEVSISEKFAVGIMGGVQLGTLEELKYNYGTHSELFKAENPEDYDSLIRYDLTLTFRMRK